jgi:hypothetical protein
MQRLQRSQGMRMFVVTGVDAGWSECVSSVEFVTRAEWAAAHPTAWTTNAAL